MKRFLVHYLIPPAVMDGWKTTDPETRRASEETMMAAWKAWTDDHAEAILGTDVTGRTKRISAEGVTDARNGLVICCFVTADSYDAAVEMFARHPHLQIPQSSIEVMEVRPMDAVAP